MRTDLLCLPAILGIVALAYGAAMLLRKRTVDVVLSHEKHNLSMKKLEETYRKKYEGAIFRAVELVLRISRKKLKDHNGYVAQAVQAIRAELGAGNLVKDGVLNKNYADLADALKDKISKEAFENLKILNQLIAEADVSGHSGESPCAYKKRMEEILKEIEHAKSDFEASIV